MTKHTDPADPGGPPLVGCFPPRETEEQLRDAARYLSLPLDQEHHGTPDSV